MLFYDHLCRLYSPRNVCSLNPGPPSGTAIRWRRKPALSLISAIRTSDLNSPAGQRALVAE